MRREEGFTLIELMIVIAIIAILAAVAISQYSSYKNKAKAKPLIGIARNCAQAVIAECIADNNFNVTTNNIQTLESCDIDSAPNMDNVTVKVSSTNASCSNFSITAKGRPTGADKDYEVQCTYNGTSLSCEMPKKS